MSLESEHALPRPARIDRLLALMLLSAVIWIYLPATRFDFVNWDDPWYVTGNELIRSWHPYNLWRIGTEVVARNFAPLNMLSYLVDHTLWGDWAGGYHLTNYLLHALNAVLVYALLTRLTGSRFVGWGTALLFAVHPVHIESVAWVSSRKGLLSATFLLGSLWYWLQPDRTQRHELRGTLLFVCALLTKAIAVVLPPIVLLYDILIRRLKLTEALPRQVIPGFLAVWLLLVTMSAQTTDIGGVREHLALSKPHLLAVDAVIVWRYLGMLAWPQELAILYDPATSGIAVQMTLAIAAWGLLAVLLWRKRREFPLLVLSAAAFWLCLMPVLNLFPITTLMNDRYLYLPSIPVFATALAAIRGSCFSSWARGTSEAVGNAWAFHARRNHVLKDNDAEGRTAPVSRRASFPAIACLLVLLAAGGLANKSRERLWVWQNGLTLWTTTRQQVPQLAVVQIQYANTMHNLGNTELAVNVLHYALANCRLDNADRRRILEKLERWQSPDSQGNSLRTPNGRVLPAGNKSEAAQPAAFTPSPVFQKNTTKKAQEFSSRSA